MDAVEVGLVGVVGVGVAVETAAGRGEGVVEAEGGRLGGRAAGGRARRTGALRPAVLTTQWKLQCLK